MRGPPAPARVTGKDGKSYPARKPRKDAPARATRKERVAEARSGGRALEQIAGEEGVDEKTVRKDLKEAEQPVSNMSETAPPPPPERDTDDRDVVILRPAPHPPAMLRHWWARCSEAERREFITEVTGRAAGEGLSQSRVRITG